VGQFFSAVLIISSAPYLFVEDDCIKYNIIDSEEYQKRYSIEEIDYSAYISNPDQTIYFAFVENNIAGQVRLKRNWNNYCYIEDLVVDVNYRRAGIGKALIQAVIDWAINKHCPGIMLETQNNNVMACLFYASCGFELAGYDKRLYQGLNPETTEIALFWYMMFNSK
jgi:streptothricin acetyltransferase